MNQEMITAIDRLQSLPPADQERLAPRINDYINKLENLRAAIQKGIDSGPGKPFDIERIKSRGRKWLEAEARYNANR